MTPTKPCHNCRRNRRRCDRSIPTCNKCRSLGQECLGYGKLLRWTDSVASRGHMKGKATYANNKVESQQPQCRSTTRKTKPLPQDMLSISQTLVDPVFQDLDHFSKFYLNYYSSRFSRDLVVHDYVGINPFKDLVPMSASHTFLRPIVIAVSALHYSNLVRRAAPGHKADSPASSAALVHALNARDDAIKALQRLLTRWQHEGSVEGPRTDNRSESERDAFFATVVFFVNFALIDGEGGGWQAHLGAAGKLLGSQAAGITSSNVSDTPNKGTQSFSGFEACLSTLFPVANSEPFETPTLTIESAALSRRLTVRDYVASDAVAYYVWKSTLESLIVAPIVTPVTSLPSPPQSPAIKSDILELDPDALLPILLRTEANCYHSCPAVLLHIMLRASQLVRQLRSSTQRDKKMEGAFLPTFLDLLLEAQAFDVEVWAAEMSARNAAELFSHMPPEVEMVLRMNIAAVYRATACLYLLLAAPGLYRYAEKVRDERLDLRDLLFLPTTSELADLILGNLSGFEPDSPFFKYTTWPVFMTGVEAGPEGHRREWVLARLQRMYDLCPWGMLKSAMSVLGQIWEIRDDISLSKSKISCSPASSRGSPENSEDVIVSLDGVTSKDDDDDWLSKLQGLQIDCLIV